MQNALYKCSCIQELQICPKIVEHCCSASVDDCKSLLQCFSGSLQHSSIQSALLTCPELCERWGSSSRAQSSRHFTAHNIRGSSWAKDVGLWLIEEKKSVLLCVVSIWCCQWAQECFTDKELHCTKRRTDLVRKNGRAVLFCYCDCSWDTPLKPCGSPVSKSCHRNSEW